jgi:hypothetical protein
MPKVRLKRALKADRRRALRLLASCRDGCTKAVAHGFTVELLADLIGRGLATMSTERVMDGGRKVEVARWRTAEAGRRALAEHRS